MVALSKSASASEVRCGAVHVPPRPSPRPHRASAFAVRVRIEAYSDKPPPPKLGGAEEPVTTLSMSAAAKEERMAAQLAAMREGGSAATASGSESAASGRSSGGTLLGYGSADGRRSSSTAKSPTDVTSGGVPLLQLNGLQRANTALLSLVLSAGFGRSSAQILDAATVESLRLAALAFALGHALIAAYGTFLAVGGGESPFGWVFKLLLTGPGGLQELRALLAKQADAEAGSTGEKA